MHTCMLAVAHMCQRAASAKHISRMLFRKAAVSDELVIWAAHNCTACHFSVSVAAVA